MQTEAEIRKHAHDPGDPQITSHCPFCGSGQVVGRSDGTIECGFCGSNYIVRVQPAFPGMPQGPMGPGAPTDIGPDGGLLPPDALGPDGMPMDDGELPPDAEEGDEGPPFGDGEEADGPPFGDDDGDGDEDDEDEGPPPSKDDSKKKPPPGKKKAARYRTLTGAELNEDAYVRHLAVLHSGGSPRVLAQLRTEAAARQQGQRA